MSPVVLSANVGALTIRTGLWGFPIIITVYCTPKPYSNLEGTYCPKSLLVPL